MPQVGLTYPLWFVEPNEANIEEVTERSVTKTLMQRYTNVTAVQEAEVVGILVGTVVVS